MENFEVLHELGRGGFATVFLCREKSSDRLVALKRVPLYRIQTLEQKRRVDAERFLLEQARHYFLSRGAGASFGDDAFYSFVMEYVEDARPLYECIWRFRATSVFPEHVARYYAAQIVLAVEALHELGYVHRDLKSGNVLVDKRGVARVIDYGFAKRLVAEQSEDGGKEATTETAVESRRTFSICGTHYIMAPEMYLRQQYGIEVDWWAVGVIVHEMVCGRPPWDYKPTEGQPLETFFDRVSAVAKGFSLGEDASEQLQSANVSDNCKAFVTALLQFNPRKRLGHVGGAAQVKAHNWLKDIDWDTVASAVDPSPYDPVADFRTYVGPVTRPLAIASSSSAESIDPDDNAKLFADF